MIYLHCYNEKKHRVQEASSQTRHMEALLLLLLLCECLLIIKARMVLYEGYILKDNTYTYESLNKHN